MQDLHVDLTNSKGTKTIFGYSYLLTPNNKDDVGNGPEEEEIRQGMSDTEENLPSFNEVNTSPILSKNDDGDFCDSEKTDGIQKYSPVTALSSLQTVFAFKYQDLRNLFGGSCERVAIKMCAILKASESELFPKIPRSTTKSNTKVMPIILFPFFFRLLSTSFQERNPNAVNALFNSLKSSLKGHEDSQPMFYKENYKLSLELQPKQNNVGKRKWNDVPEKEVSHKNVKQEGNELSLRIEKIENNGELFFQLLAEFQIVKKDLQELSKLRQENCKLIEHVNDLSNQIECLEKKVPEMEANITAITIENEYLRHRVGALDEQTEKNTQAVKSMQGQLDVWSDLDLKNT